MATESTEHTHDEFETRNSDHVLAAQEALAMIERGEPIVGHRIERLVLKGEFQHEVRFERCQLLNLQIRGAKFSKPVEFKGCKLRRARFHAGTRFEDSVDMSGATVIGLRMEKVTVLGVWLVKATDFAGALTLSKCTLHSIRGFGATFGDWVEFKHCEFNDRIDLRSSHFVQGLSFQNSKLSADVNLRGITLEKKFDLNGATLDGHLDLSKAKLRDFVYLQDLKIGDDACFSFTNALADYMHVTPEQLEGRLHSEQEKRFDDAALEYGLLKRNYSTLHRYDEEDWAFYRFKVNQRKSRTFQWSRPWTIIGRVFNYLFLDLGCGYGVQPWRALLFGLGVILFFGLVFAAGTTHFVEYHPPIAGLNATSLVNQFLFGLLTSISVFTAGFTGDHLNNAGGWVLVPLAFEAVVGTVVWGLFIVAFSRKVIR